MLEFYFLTKDFFADYNIVGWMPQPDLSFLEDWKKYNVQDYPELLIVRDGSSWTVFTTSLPTGRTDYMQRDIQLHLIIKGSVEEEKGREEGRLICGLLKEIYPYLQNQYNNNGSVELLKIFSDFIHKDEPIAWSKQEEEKEGRAQQLGEKLLNLGKMLVNKGDEDTAWPSPDRWYGGDNNARDNFQKACEALLTQEGITSGAAVSLGGIGQYEIDRFVDPEKKRNQLAILIKGSSITQAPLPEKTPTEPPETQQPPEQSEQSTGTEKEKKDDKKGRSSKQGNENKAFLERGVEKICEILNTKIFLILVALLCAGFGVSSYNSSCNSRAIAQIVQAVEKGEAVDQKALDRVTRLAGKHNQKAESALGEYYSASIEQAAKQGLVIEQKVLDFVTELAGKNNPTAEFALGCYYSADKEKDLKKAEDFFNRAVQHGDAALQEKAKAKLTEIQKMAEEKN